MRSDGHVINTQTIVDLTTTYALSKQVFVQARIPFNFGSWSVLSGPKIPQEARRAVQRANGLSDISFVMNSWLLPVDRHPGGNLSLGIGIKPPTGDWNKKWRYPDLNGENNVRKTVDQSIQLGDRELGIIGQYQAFKSFKYITFFSTAQYLVSTRKTTGVPSLLVGLGLKDRLPQFEAEFVNSAPDQYLGTTGVVIPVPKVRGLAIFGDARISGVPQTSLFAGGTGFRRPAKNLYTEPGVIYTRGKDTWSISVPIRSFTQMLTVPVDGRRADSTIPNWQILARYTRTI